MDDASPPPAGAGEPRDPSLEALQAWFGRAISRPLPETYGGNPLGVSAPELLAEGEAWVRGRKDRKDQAEQTGEKGQAGLSGFERLGVYNEQYWFRLIGIMQGEYPCAVHLIGLKPFNAWCMRFLSAHPPSSPYLARLDDEWPAFLAREYREPDREAVLEAVAVDRAFSRAVDAPDGLPLPAEAAALADLPLRLAPHAAVLALTFDFPAYRALCLADESLERRFELEAAPLNLLIWRGRDMLLWQKPLAAAARKVLAELREPARLAEAFDRLEGSLTPAERGELEANLPAWFAEWAREGVLARA